MNLVSVLFSKLKALEINHENNDVVFIAMKSVTRIDLQFLTKALISIMIHLLLALNIEDILKCEDVFSPKRRNKTLYQCQVRIVRKKDLQL